MPSPAGGGPNLGPFTDSQGRPFYLNPQTKAPVYVSPAAYGGSAPPNQQWNQDEGKWEPISDSKLTLALNLAVGGLLTGGLLSAAGVFGGAGSAAGSGVGASADAGGTIAGLGGIEGAATTGLGTAAGIGGTVADLGAGSLLPAAATTAIGAGLPAATATGAITAPLTAGIGASTPSIVSKGLSLLSGSAPNPWLSLIGTGANILGNIYGANKQADTSLQAAQMQIDAANHAADLQAKAAADQLAFAKQQADLAQQNYMGTQQFNRSVYTDQQARLAPYRAFGQGAVSQLGQPIPGAR